MRRVALLAMFFLATACSAYRIRPAEMSSNRDEVLLAGKVRIKTEYGSGRAEQWAAEALVRQKLSDSVITATSEELSDYVLDLQSSFTGKCFSEPLLTVLTVGVIPSTGCTEVGHKISLTDGNGRPVAVADSGRQVDSVFGLAAWFLLLSPSWVGEKGLDEYQAGLVVKELSKLELATQ